MKLSKALFLACLISSPALADNTALCKDDDLDSAERIAACQQVVDANSDKAEPHARLGDAFLDAEQIPEALEALNRAVEFDPDHIFALERRSVAFNEAGRHGEAVQDLEQLIQLNPNQDWYHYRLGYSQNQLGNLEAALAALDRAIELDGDYYWSLIERGRTLRRMERDEEAGNSYADAARIRPLSTSAHTQAYRHFNWAGLSQRQAYHARILYTLDPNKLSLRDWLKGFVGADAAKTLEPLEWTPPPKDQEIRYFQIFAPVDAREDTQKAIEELINFFGGRSYPMPETASVYRRSYEGANGDDLTPVMNLEHRKNGTPPRHPPQDVFRGLFQLNVQPFGPGTPVIAPVWGNTQPTQAWPLRNGASAQGTATFTAMCATGPGMSAILMGCRPDIETVPLGQIDWNVDVTSDRIHVPMGIFDTYKVSYSQRGDITILGKSNSFAYDASYWIVPELNTWVAAIFTVGDKYSYSQAMEIVP